MAAKDLDRAAGRRILVADHVPRLLDDERRAVPIDPAGGIEAVPVCMSSVAPLCAAVNHDDLTGLLNRGPFQILRDDAATAAAVEQL